MVQWRALLLEVWKHGRPEESLGVKEFHTASGATIKWKMEVVRHEVNRWRLTGGRPSIIFLQESTAVSYGTCTQQNFNAKQAKKKTMLPAHKVNWFPAFVGAGSDHQFHLFLMALYKPVQFYRSSECVHSRLWLLCLFTCCVSSYLPVVMFPWRTLMLIVFFFCFFFFTGSTFKLSHDLSGIMPIKAILCGDFPLCALLS